MHLHFPRCITSCRFPPPVPSSTLLENLLKISLILKYFLLEQVASRLMVINHRSCVSAGLTDLTSPHWIETLSPRTSCHHYVCFTDLQIPRSVFPFKTVNMIHTVHCKRWSGRHCIAHSTGLISSRKCVRGTSNQCPRGAGLALRISKFTYQVSSRETSDHIVHRNQATKSDQSLCCVEQKSSWGVSATVSLGLLSFSTTEAWSWLISYRVYGLFDFSLLGQESKTS